MKITLTTTAQDFKYVLEKYYVYKPTFVEAKQDGDVAFTLDFGNFGFEAIYKLIFLIGQDCMLQQCKKTLNYANPTEYDYSSTEQSF